MKNVFTILVVCAMAFGQAIYAQTFQSINTNPVTPLPASAAGATVDLILSQPADAGGPPSQTLEAPFAAYDAELADDFVIPAGGSRTIVSFQPSFMSSTGLPVWEGPVIMNVYADAGGAPGALIFSESFFNPIVNDPLISVNCPPLAPGTYWISAVVDQDFLDPTGAPTFGQAFQDVSNTNTAGPGVVHWRNPGNAFGSGCTAFMPLIGCLGVPNPGAAFNLNLSEEIIEEVAPIPTMGEWGLIVLGIMLLIFGLVAVNQKQTSTNIIKA